MRVRVIPGIVMLVLVLVLVWAIPGHYSNASGAGKSAQRVRYTHTVPALGGKNLVPNGSFEAGRAGWGSLGLGAGYKNLWAELVGNWGNLATLHGTVEKTGGADGPAFLRIPLGGKNTPVFNFDYFYPVNRRELRPLAANQGWIEVRPGKPYTISVAMRASREGVPAAFGAQNDDAGEGWKAGDTILQKVTLGRDWKRYSHTFTPQHPYLFVLAGPDLASEEDVMVDVDAIQLEAGDKATAFAPREPLECGILPTAAGGVFTVGEPAALEITACNHAAAPQGAQVKFKVTDYFGRAVELPGVNLDLPAKGTLVKLVTLPEAWRGFYRVHASFETGKIRQTRLVRMAIVPRHTVRDSVIGVNHAFPTRDHIDLAKKAGVTWYRDWSLKWQHVEPRRGERHWEVSDPQLTRVGEQGANLMAMIPFPSAEWNSSAPSLQELREKSPCYKTEGQGDSGELLPRARWAWVPREEKELIDFTRDVVDRYRKQVDVWEFLNEPIFTSYALPGEGVLRTKELKPYTIQDYLGLLRAAAPAIRAANPKAKIMGGPAMWAGGWSTIPMIESGILRDVDIFGLHDYPGRSKPETRIEPSRKMLAAMKANGGLKPIWMTEFCYYGTDDLPREPFEPVPGLHSEVQLLSEKEVADNIIRFATIFLGHGGEKLFLHAGTTDSVNNPGTEACLFTEDSVCKAFPALAVFTELMGSRPRFAADRGRGGAYLYAFEAGRRAVVVAWDPGENTSLTLPSRAECLDIMGRTLEGPRVKLGASPVYIIGLGGKARSMFEACNAAIHQ